MSEALSIKISPDLHERLERLAIQTNRSIDAIVGDALHRYLVSEEFRAIRKRLLPHAMVQGVLTDDDVFRLVS